MTRYISIDVATKSLAVSIIDYNNLPIDLEDKDTFKNLTIIKTITKDLAPGRSSSSIKEIDRVSLIKEFYTNELSKYITKDTTALIEKQISTTPTYIVYIALLTLFINDSVDVQTIAATYKNQLVVEDECIGKYLRQCTDSYRANKQHSKALVAKIRPFLTDSDKIEINKKMETDWSDTISQLIAYLQ